ncbi:MAG: hypothetical protein CMD25_08020 [Flavobacteriales bacterium]|nr:hypothetical protein [Flavobacteriales bacterium]
MINLLSNLNHRDQDNLCKVLQCNKEELSRLFKQAEKLYSKKYSLYEIYMKVLQQGFNVREATLIGILCGSIIGYNFAEEDMENAIKDKLFNAFKNNNLYNNRK